MTTETQKANTPLTLQAFFSGCGLGASVKKIDLINFDLITNHTEVTENGVARLDKNRLLSARYTATVDYNLGFEIDFSGSFLARPRDGKGKNNLKEEIEGLRDNAVINVTVNNAATEIMDSYYGDINSDLLVVLKSMQAIAITEAMSLGCEEGAVGITDKKGNQSTGLCLSLNAQEESVATGWLIQALNNRDESDVDSENHVSLHTSFKNAVIDELLRLAAIAC